MEDEKPQTEATSPEKPTPKPDDLGRFTSLQAKQRSLQNLKAPFKPGQVTPGAGRPRSDGPATRVLRKLLRKKFPGDGAERTYLQLVCEGLVKSAIKGNTLACALIFERTDGRLPLPIESDMPVNITVQVVRNVARPECDLLRDGKLLEADTSSKAND